jgi:lysozyme family protein
MMEIIMGYEGHATEPKIFIAPDGNPEISGITRVDHPVEYAKLAALLAGGKKKELREEVIRYYDEYTDPAQNWTDQAGPEFFLRDCVLNRGPTGAAEILQMALGLGIDHRIGPTTREALAKLDPNVAIDKLRDARERYEDKKYGKASRMAKGQWVGLLNRWNKAQAQAKAFQKEQTSSGATSPEVVITTTIVVGTGAAVEAARQYEFEWGMLAFIGVAGLIVAYVAWRAIRNFRKA